MQDKTVCQIYATYQVFKASTVIQELFYLGRISWNKIYSALLNLENKLLMAVDISRNEIEALM
ncbi:hypothetical protein BST81_10300 [Leptolyngbya sp. 'hensonii']|nr:hypothetical protein BST81_10300 [Leptolyngbya sp. 'hensonii']